MVEHHGMLYADLRDPVALLRDPLGDTELARFWAYARAAEPGALDARRVADYSALMSASQQLVAHEILDVYPLRRHRCVLDVGGGEGGFLIAAAQRSPRLRLMLFDLPAVAARARERFAAAGLAARASALGGDFLREELPRGADLVSLVRVLHDHDDAAALAILRAVGRALPPGGRLLLAEPMSAERGARPMGDAYFGWYLLAMGSGRPRTPARLAGLLREAGFGRVRALPARQPLLARVLIAHRAGTRSPEVS
jgi:demethylspheroidene O-methyltransferase